MFGFLKTVKEKKVAQKALTAAALRIACAANFGTEKIRSTSAPEAFSDTICESTVGSLVL